MNSMDNFKKLFDMWDERDENEQYSPIATASDEHKQLYKELDEITEKLKNLMAEQSSKREYFWAKIKKDTGCYGKNLRYDPETQMILVEMEKKE